MLFSFADMGNFPYHSFQSLALVALQQLEAALSCGQSQLLKSMRELTTNSSKDGLDDGFGPQAMTNLMSTKPNKASKWKYQGVAENHDKQFATSVLAPQFYSHSKHYYPLLLTFLTLFVGLHPEASPMCTQHCPDLSLSHSYINVSSLFSLHTLASFTNHKPLCILISLSNSLPFKLQNEGISPSFCSVCVAAVVPLLFGYELNI